MSDTITEEEKVAALAERTRRRVENLARARAIKTQLKADRDADIAAQAAAAKAPPPEKRQAYERDAVPREEYVRDASPRVAAEAGMTGVGAYPGPAERAMPAREADIPETFTRVRREERQANAFSLPSHRKKQGWDYEFKVARVLNMPVDPSEFQEIRRSGWRPELAKDWPELSDPDASPDSPVEVLGQRLYGRPMRLTNEARQEDLDWAMRQQRDRTRAAATGKSAIRGGDDAISSNRAIRTVPIQISVEGEAG